MDAGQDVGSFLPLVDFGGAEEEVFKFFRVEITHAFMVENNLS